MRRCPLFPQLILIPCFAVPASLLPLWLSLENSTALGRQQLLLAKGRRLIAWPRRQAEHLIPGAASGATDAPPEDRTDCGRV